jgi:hypothetical protein
MLSKRIFRINIIKPGQTKTPGLDTKSDKEIFYEGKRVSVKI